MKLALDEEERLKAIQEGKTPPSDVQNYDENEEGVEEFASTTDDEHDEL